MLDVKYEGLGDTGLVTTPLTMALNLSECNVSNGGIAHLMKYPIGACVWCRLMTHDMHIIRPLEIQPRGL